MNQPSRNQPCPCGSGVKYKRCHGRAHHSPDGNIQQVINLFRKASRIRKCLHPKAGPHTCAGKIVDAHTIQKQHLSRISREGHVYRTHGPPLHTTDGPTLIGFREASTFSGFCQKHDNSLFAPLEKQDWAATPLQVGLLGYRAICHELMAKQSLISGFSALIDRYPDADNEYLVLMRIGAQKSQAELEQAKKEFHEVVMGPNLHRVSSYVVELSNTPEVMCSATSQTTHDFRGNRLANLADFDRTMNWTTFSLLATNTGGVIVFSWLSDPQALNERMIRTLDDLSDTQLPHAIIRYAFEFFENTFFSPSWWDKLHPRTQAELKERIMQGLPGDEIHADACLADDGVRTVDWQITSRGLRFGSDPRDFVIFPPVPS